MKFQVNDFSILGNLTAHINQMWANGEKPLVTVENKTDDRSGAQNRLMHMWFKDIAKSTGNDVIEEAGRCKFVYFLPVLGISENEESRFAADLLRMIYKQRGYEYLVQALGRSMIESTRLLTVKEFEQALTSMQVGERAHKLTNPDVYGYRWAQ